MENPRHFPPLRAGGEPGVCFAFGEESIYGTRMPLIINGETVPDELVGREFEGIKAHYERMGAMSCCERDPEFREYARENVVARVLINQEAERRFPVISEEEITAALENLMAQQGGRAAFLSHAGLTDADEPMVRQEVACGCRVDRLMMETWGGAEPTEAEMRAFYEANPDRYLTAEQVRASHLFKQIEKVEDRPTVYDLLRRLRCQALGGADFDEIARENTDREDKNPDLGFFGRGEFMEEFDTIVFSMETGEVSPVFTSHWGFHLVRVTDRRPPTVKVFEEVRDQVRTEVEAEHRSRTTRDLVDRLKATAVISDG
ncbi:MAG: prsA1 [Verrucomicrobiales bacterium]|nr:prsA1 [Verrucomicrobiales bacterium]